MNGLEHWIEWMLVFFHFSYFYFIFSSFQSFSRFFFSICVYTNPALVQKWIKYDFCLGKINVFINFLSPLALESTTNFVFRIQMRIFLWKIYQMKMLTITLSQRDVQQQRKTPTYAHLSASSLAYQDNFKRAVTRRHAAYFFVVNENMENLMPEKNNFFVQLHNKFLEKETNFS